MIKIKDSFIFIIMLYVICVITSKFSCKIKTKRTDIIIKKNIYNEYTYTLKYQTSHLTNL